MTEGSKLVSFVDKVFQEEKERRHASYKQYPEMLIPEWVREEIDGEIEMLKCALIKQFTESVKNG